MKSYWLLNPYDFAALKAGLPDVAKWADTIATETVLIGSGNNVPHGHVLDEASFGLKPFDFAIATCGLTRERAVTLLRRIQP